MASQERARWVLTRAEPSGTWEERSEPAGEAAITVTPPKILISYRREETAAYAGRLYETMAVRFDQRNVFMDVGLQPGADFAERIVGSVQACDLVLVVMGPQWAGIVDEEGGLRLDDPGDYVRLEVEAALRAPRVSVVPVLVGAAAIPDSQDLPEGLRALAQQEALELSDTRWRYDVKHLCGYVEGILGTAPRTRPPSASSRLRKRLAALFRSNRERGQ